MPIRARVRDEYGRATCSSRGLTERHIIRSSIGIGIGIGIIIAQRSAAQHDIRARSRHPGQEELALAIDNRQRFSPEPLRQA